MFKLTEEELENSLQAINHHGYSAMLPEPAEWQVVKDNWPKVRDIIKEIDLDTYAPYKLMEIFAPKNRANIRAVHLLHPQDLIIYTALTLIIKNDIEAHRLPKKTQRVFSFRVDTLKSDRLYEAKSSYTNYLSQLERKSKKSGVKFVAIADIADFYPRIYQHRLENALQALASTPRNTEVARVLVKKLISNLMSKNSYGIPVGPYASRILAEALLIDVDSYLHSNHIDFVRWVDDFSFFCNSEYEAQAILFDLGEWLYVQHGLTLQSAKTQILTIKRYAKEKLAHPDKSITTREGVIQFLKAIKSDYEDEDSDAEPEEDEIQETLEILQSSNLEQMLRNSLSDKTLVDYEIVKYVLTKLPKISGAPDSLRDSILNIIIDNAELLYPVSEQIAKFILSFPDLSKLEKKKIAKKLLGPLISKRRKPPVYYTIWMLHVLMILEDWGSTKDIIEIYRNSSSDVTRRYAALVISKSGTRAEALAIKDGIISAHDLLKMAILMASVKLGSDERKHWRQSHLMNGIVEKIL